MLDNVTMAESKDGKTGIEVVCKSLFDFAIDRRDVVDIMARLPEIPGVRRATVEHELQILKIISVGWGISFYLPAGPLKEEVAVCFWQAVRDFSKSLSSTAELLINQDVDFFAAVRGRFDKYLEEMKRHVNAPEPAVVIGPEFARCCGSEDDAHTVMAGSRMFVGTVNEVKRYFEANGLGASSLH
jgi:hypothetical protein